MKTATIVIDMQEGSFSPRAVRHDTADRPQLSATQIIAHHNAI